MKYFSYFSQKTGFDISCKLSTMEIVCMKSHIQFSRKNKKKIIKLLSAESVHKGDNLHEISNPVLEEK